MFKRVRWLSAGVAVGVGGSLWAQRKAKALAERYRPTGLAAEAADKARAIPSEVRAAIREGRHAMREREAELRASKPAETVPANQAPART